MKKLLILMMAVVSVSVITFGITVNDVSQSSDLYPYVVEMVQDNIMSLDSNGNFNGSLVITRADMARVLSHLLNYMQGRIQPVTQVTQSTSASTKAAIPPDLLLKIQSVENSMQKYANLEGYITTTSSVVSSLSDQLQQIQRQVNAMKGLVASLSGVKNIPPASLLSQTIDRVTALEGKVGSMNYQISVLTKSVGDATAKMDSMNSSIDATLTSIRADISNLNNTVQNISGQRQNDSQAVADATAKMAGTQSKIEDLAKENSQLKDRVSSLESTLGNVYLFQVLEAVAMVGVVAYFFMVK